MDRRDFSVNDFSRGIQAFQIIEEETFARRRSVRGLQQAMGNAFDAEDEEGEVFDNVYLGNTNQTISSILNLLYAHNKYI